MNITEQLLLLSEGNLYWKNTKGEYLGCNSNFSKMIGLKSPLDIIGKTDRDLFLSTLGEDKLSILMEIDKSVISQRKTLLKEEVGVNDKGELAVYITKKSPLIDDKNGKVIYRPRPNFNKNR